MPPCARRVGRVILLQLNIRLLPLPAHAGGGPLGIDHRLSYDDGGIWKRSYQTGLLDLMLVGDAAVAVCEGGNSRLGKTYFRAPQSVRNAAWRRR